MRTSFIAALTVVVSLLVSSAASGSVPHTVAPGETLWSIAAANGMSPGTLAAANGLSPEAHVVLGSTIQIPAAGAATTAPVTAAGASSGAPAPIGGHTVLPGETLSGIAARAGVSARELAWMNGLDPAAPLLYGTALKLPTGAPQAATPQAPPTRVPQAAPYASPGRASSGQIAQIAAANGVPGSLASAIGWQESGFNNSMVSSANARGVMQVMPGTWQWVQNNLASSQLDPSSPSDNVRAGVLYLHQLLRDTGGDEAAAAAAYYQGLGSVRAQGMLPETRRYVNNVMALRGRFGK